MTDTEYLLLVDDDPGVLRTMSLWLKGEGFSVLTAADREEALRLQQKHHVVMGMIDLRLKGDDGLQIGAELSQRDERMKIIIITGYPSVEGAVDAMRAGVFDYVSKDADNEQILQKVRQALDARREQLRLLDAAAVERTKVVLVGHHGLVREGLQTLFREGSEFQLWRTYHDAAYVRPAEFSLDVGLLLLCALCNEIHFGNAGKMFHNLRLVFPRARVLVINSGVTEETQMELVRLGARGFLPPHTGKEAIQKAFQALMRGDMWISRGLSNRLLADLLEDTAERVYVKPEAPFSLSRREVEILQAMASGLSNAQIGEKLFLSEKTVKTHIHHIFGKMEVSTRTQAVLKAMEFHIF